MSDLALSWSTVHRVRRSGREALAKQLGSTSATPDRLVLHWDGKLLPAISGEQEVQDRIAVLVTGEGQEQLLGVPLALDGTGQRMAEVVLNELEKADLRDLETARMPLFFSHSEKQKKLRFVLFPSRYNDDFFI